MLDTCRREAEERAKKVKSPTPLTPKPREGDRRASGIRERGCSIRAGERQRSERGKSRALHP